ncbi:MAG: DUF4878 domain-containing protein [Firmicutes bacterium]|nr:DUF4878 domain-containing protein [Bacillota bacterium]
MIGIVRAIISIIVAVMIQGGVSGVVESPPEDAVTEFMTALTSGNEQVLERYVDNEYVNFLLNVEGKEKTVKRMNQALFKNLEYEIDKSAQKGGVAVVKVRVKTNDFRDVLEKYEEASYQYVMDNLYEDKVTDKKKLNAKCLDIYVDQIEKDAEEEVSLKKTLYFPMIDDGYGGWKLLIDNKIMKALMGKLAMPD